MAKFTLKEIREIRATTPAELADRTYAEIGPVQWLGGYSAPSWNWGYKVGAFVYNGRCVVAVFQFGSIVC